MFPGRMFPCITVCHTSQSDSANHLIRRMIISSGAVSTLAGQAGVSRSANGIGTNAIFYQPKGVAVNAAENFVLVVSLLMI